MDVTYMLFRTMNWIPSINYTKILLMYYYIWGDTLLIYSQGMGIHTDRSKIQKSNWLDKYPTKLIPLQWRRNGRDGVSNDQPHHCLLNRIFRSKSKETSKLRVTGLYAGNSPVTGEFPTQRASNAENVSIRWRHHAITITLVLTRLETYAWAGMLS